MCNRPAFRISAVVHPSVAYPHQDLKNRCLSALVLVLLARMADSSEEEKATMAAQILKASQGSAPWLADVMNSAKPYMKPVRFGSPAS